ncbi:alcohol dehydrogenase [Cryobacterium sp. TMT2-18-3]|uniref:alcohol dehydrogenase catalytic domain-containing protein n=1 Tax=unclassified Cryobacterium TaxID=2649013 RepID=UPI00106D105D|nr:MULTISPECIES: alcohol dehydrogenase catalytic domain-containing protein [unclassified Cryobacterium]TFC29641.1 alcohol dehydrogenase [Cryobacterium sp. TMT2-18-2]TFC39884.1 alcohol dehydrogenase [Cryobacterium sp. TMT2-42-4]TFC65799.1 alcohol dehydrogenase [Cryobacterium sp. TMT2-18-3]
MRAVWFDAFGAVPELREVPDPVPSASGVVVRVEATGLCRSDWHGWLGHDAGIALPHVPGHELVGVIDAVGPEVRRFAVGQRVTVPFVCACGDCPECRGGNGQVCRNQTQPGFTHWGSYAERVALHNADVNLIAIPVGLDAGAAALLGCRFATSYRGLVHQARLQAGESLVVVGCGGVGLSAVMIGAALGATVIAVDISAAARETAARVGATFTVDSAGLSNDEVVARIRSVTGRGADAGSGAQVSVEALGRESTVGIAIRSLATRGRHVQIGLLAEDPRLPLGDVIARELTVMGSHGMPAGDYPALLALVTSGRLRPQDLIGRRLSLAEAPAALAAMSDPAAPGGVTLIELARP